MRCLSAVVLAAGCVGCGGTDAEVAADMTATPHPRFIAADAPDISGVPTLVLVAELATRGMALERVLHVRGEWTPPTSGSPVDWYAVEIETRGELRDIDQRIWYVAAPEITIALLTGSAAQGQIRGRTAGIDALGRQGDWSLWSEWHLITED